MLLKILQNIHFWAGSITLRGHDDSKCNFMQLLNLQAAKIVERFDKYTSPDIQNELLQIMALEILRSVAADFQSTYFLL